MLWCKATFVSHFSESHCRLFPTQQQMFDFIDSSPTNESWMPFGIEFPSEFEVSRALAHRSTANAKPLFLQKREREKETVESPHRPHTQQQSQQYHHSVGLYRRRQWMREDYAILYGTVPLSSQSRMFLAATREGIANVVQTLEPLQQHVYEVIREGIPCHAYLDVEREMDYVVHVIDSSSSEAKSIPSEEEKEEEIRNDVTCLDSGNPQAHVWDPDRPQLSMHCCPMDCPIRADNKATTNVLLAEFQRFLTITSPAFLAYREGTQVDEAEVKETNESLREVYTEALGECVYPLEVFVLRSTGGAKFSQHYLFKWRNRWFRHNADVGCLVTAFVDYLYTRVPHMPEVHAALFYHDSPQHGNLPLRCVIDKAVYSRNRMLRCLGSCKLHKTGILTLERRIGIGMHTIKDMPQLTRSKEELFFSTLVTYSEENPFKPLRTCMDMETETPYYTSCGMRSIHHHHHHHPRDGLSASDIQCVVRNSKGFEALALHIAQAWTDIGGVPCHVTGIRQMGTRMLILSLEGSRYCARIGREHRSNRVYVCVDLERSVWVQKCFDPDCVAFRTQERTIPPGVIMLTPRESTAVRRTIFRTGES